MDRTIPSKIDCICSFRCDRNCDSISISRIVNTNFDNIGLYGCGSIVRRNTNPILNKSVFRSYVSSSTRIVGRDNKWILCVDTFMMLPANSLPVIMYSLHESNIVDEDDSLVVLLFVAVRLLLVVILLLLVEFSGVAVVGVAATLFVAPTVVDDSD